MNHIVTEGGVIINDPTISLTSLISEFGKEFEYLRVNLDPNSLKHKDLELRIIENNKSEIIKSGENVILTPSETTLMLGFFKYLFLTRDEMYTLFSHRDVNEGIFGVFISKINKKVKETFGGENIILSKYSQGFYLSRLSMDHRPEANLFYQDKLVYNSITNYCALLNDNNEPTREYELVPSQGEILEKLLKFQRPINHNSNRKSFNVQVFKLRKNVPELIIKTHKNEGYTLLGVNV